MKKLLALVFSAVIMAAGLVSVAQTPANADCPYTACIATTTKLRAPSKVKAGTKVAITVSVSARDGDGEPKGKVTVTVKGKGFTWSTTVKYTGTKRDLETSKLKNDGKYKVLASFDAAPGSVYRDSKDTDTILVK